MGYIWYFFFQYQGGAINDIILLFHDQPSNLLGDPNLNVWIITFVNTYQYLGIAMVLYLAGLQSIPRDYYEAATIDGAGPLQRFAHVTWPLIAPAFTVSMVLNLIGGLKLFDVIVALTNSGPGYASASLSSIMYLLYFGREDAGYAATIGILMFIMISIVSITALLFLRKRRLTHEEQTEKPVNAILPRHLLGAYFAFLYFDNDISQSLRRSKLQMGVSRLSVLR